MFHRSERLLLRPVFAEDWREIHEALNDEGIVRMLASPPWPFLEQDARDWAAQPEAPGKHRFAITLPGAWGSRLIGSIGLSDRGDGPEVGFWLARPHWGKGFATEAGRAVVAIARTLGVRRLKAGHAVDNPASGRVLRKLGFRPTGETRPEFSNGRGGEVMSCRYENELDAGEGQFDPSDMACAA